MTDDTPDAEDPVLGIDQDSYSFATTIADTLQSPARFPDPATHTPSVSLGIHIDRHADITIDNPLDVPVVATIYERVKWRTYDAPNGDGSHSSKTAGARVPAGGSVTKTVTGVERPHYVTLEPESAPSSSGDVTVTFDNPRIRQGLINS